MRNSNPFCRQFVPLTDEEIYALLEQGRGDLLLPYRVGGPCQHRGLNPPALPLEQLLASTDWPEVA